LRKKLVVKALYAVEKAYFIHAEEKRTEAAFLRVKNVTDAKGREKSLHGRMRLAFFVYARGNYFFGFGTRFSVCIGFIPKPCMLPRFNEGEEIVRAEKIRHVYAYVGEQYEEHGYAVYGGHRLAE
jgi:hypothetical protein